MWYCHKRYIVFINIDLFSKAGENGTDERILNSRILHVVTAVYVIASTINHFNAASWLFTPFFNRDIIGYQIMSFDQLLKLSMSCICLYLDQLLSWYIIVTLYNTKGNIFNEEYFMYAAYFIFKRYILKKNNWISVFLNFIQLISKIIL